LSRILNENENPKLFFKNYISYEDSGGLNQNWIDFALCIGMSTSAQGFETLTQV
jgi:hypothetical protein